MVSPAHLRPNFYRSPRAALGSVETSFGINVERTVKLLYVRSSANLISRATKQRLQVARANRLLVQGRFRAYLDIPQDTYNSSGLRSQINSLQRWGGEVIPKLMTGTVVWVRTGWRISATRGGAYTKLQILLVREVEKLAVLLMLNTRHETVSALVLVRVIRHQKGCCAARKGGSHDNSDLCGDIFGRILASESQRANDVPEAWA